MPDDVLDALPRNYPRSFLPADLEIRQFDDVKSWLDKLFEADVSTVEGLEQWLRDCSEVTAAIQEVGTRIHVRMTLDTADESRKAAFLDFVENFEPRLKPVADRLNRKFAESPAREKLDPVRFGIYSRAVMSRIKLFREENIPLETELSKLDQQYEEIMGATTVSFEGEERTPQQMAKYQLEPDRDLRERAFRATWERRLQDAKKVNALFENMVRRREKVAKNAGFPNFRDYQFQALERFDYGPELCEAYHHAVEQAVLPAVARIQERRRKAMGLTGLRPWDTAVDPHSRPPLKPFTDVKELDSGCSRIFHRVDEALGSQFDEMRSLGVLDLANRKGKAPGGYQATFSEARLPFIFMNAVGVDGDVRTLLHEGGHAFHTFAARGQELFDYRHAPMEFCEVASMSMELLGNPYLEEFYAGDDLKRARREFLEEVILYLPWFATIDAYQHWLYTHEGHTTADRTEAWLKTFRRFNSGPDWSGLEEIERHYWHRQGHLFGVPFYYIEYAAAQLGALQVWRNARKDRPAAIRKYREALALGGSRKLPELFEAAGARFDLGIGIVGPLVQAVEEELATLE